MSFKPIKDGLAFLIKDHRKVDSLFQHFKSTQLLSERRRIVGDLVKELSTHAAIEEQVLYPIVRHNITPNQEGNALADNSLKEHQEVKDKLYELENMSETDPQYESKVLSLEEAVTHHVNEEENEIFPKLRHVLSENDLKDMYTILSAASQFAPTHAHPGVPNTPPANLFTGPLAGVWDRLRDTLHKSS